MGFEGGHYFFAACRRRAEDESEKEKLLETFNSSAATDYSLMRDVGMEQIREKLKAFVMVQTYIDSDVRAAHCIFILCSKKDFSPLFLSSSTFLPSVVAKKKRPARTSRSQSVPTTTKALLLLLGIG